MAVVGPAATPTRQPAPAPAVSSAPAPNPQGQHIDLDVQRVQQSGGPLDHASYNCSCGYIFCADVSTSVTCPHCGTSQAW